MTENPNVWEPDITTLCRIGTVAFDAGYDGVRYDEAGTPVGLVAEVDGVKYLLPLVPLDSVGQDRPRDV